jgi:hypothetical protein
LQNDGPASHRQRGRPYLSRYKSHITQTAAIFSRSPTPAQPPSPGAKPHTSAAVSFRKMPPHSTAVILSEAPQARSRMDPHRIACEVLRSKTRLLKAQTCYIYPCLSSERQPANALKRNDLPSRAPAHQAKSFKTSNLAQEKP